MLTLISVRAKLSSELSLTCSDCSVAVMTVTMAHMHTTTGQPFSSFNLVKPAVVAFARSLQEDI